MSFLLYFIFQRYSRQYQYTYNWKKFIHGPEFWKCDSVSRHSKFIILLVSSFLFQNRVKDTRSWALFHTLPNSIWDFTFLLASEIAVFCFPAMKQMNAFGAFCCVIVLLFILEAHQRANLVITDAKVKHRQLQFPVRQIVFKRMARLINIYSQTHHSHILLGQNVCRCCGNVVYLYTMLMHWYGQVHNAVWSCMVRRLHIWFEQSCILMN